MVQQAKLISLLVVLVVPGLTLAETFDITAGEDVWVQSINSNSTYNADFLDVRRTIDTAAGPIEIRYGLAQFDLGALAGKTVTGVELILDEMGSSQGAGSSAALPIQTVAFAAGASSNAPNLLTTTWNTYQAGYEGREDFAFATLGAYNLPANGAQRTNRNSFANTADMAFIQSLVNSTNKLTLVLKPTSPGTNIGHSFGDGELNGTDAILRVTTRVTQVPPATIAATEEVWIRDIFPTNTYNGDFLDVRRTIDGSLNGTVEVRYGLAQFNLSALAGQMLTGVELVIDHLGSSEGVGSSALAPIQTLAFAIGSSNSVPDLRSLTWNSYQASYEGREAGAFYTLGQYDLPAPGTYGGSRSSLGNPADVALIQQVVNGSGILTLALKPAAPGTNIAASFGDGELGGAKACLRVTVLQTEPPSVSAITVQPAGTNLPVGSTVRLSVTGTGSIPLVYQWLRNGEPMAGGHGAALTLSNLQPEQSGGYSVIVTNTLGSATSTVATVTVDSTRLIVPIAGGEDVWISSAAPGGNYPADRVEVRRASEVRYGLVQFDLSSLAGQEVKGVELILDELGSSEGAGISATLPIQTVGFALGVSNSALNLRSMTWNAYQSQYEGREDGAFSALGKYDLPPPGGNGGARSTFGNAADLVLMQKIVDGSGILTLVLKPTTNGSAMAGSFGDGEAAGAKAVLLITTPITLRAQATTNRGVQFVFSNQLEMANTPDGSYLPAHVTSPHSVQPVAPAQFGRLQRPERLYLPWRAYVTNCIEALMQYGTDRYGPTNTDMLMCIVDVVKRESPQPPLLLDGNVYCEGRPQRRGPGGANLWSDMATLRVMYRLANLTGNPKYSQFADRYIATYFSRAVKPNGMLAWGSHIWYDAYNDTIGGDAAPGNVHEILILHPEWAELYRLNPAATRTEIEGIWEWHVIDKATGQHNRHDDGNLGHSFAFSGGSFALANAFMYAQTGQTQYLARAKLIANWHWSHRDPVTGLVPDDASTYSTRYDATHCFTTITGPHASQLLRCYELTGDVWFRDVAVSYIKAYDRWGYDATNRTYYGMIQLDGTPVPEQPQGQGYDAWATTGPVDIWKSTIYSYEFPVCAAQSSIYACELTAGPNGGGDPELLAIAQRWAEIIEANLPVKSGRRWKTQREDALPLTPYTGGNYAEDYGRAVSFFVHLYHATGQAHYLQTAEQVARDAVDKLYVNGLFRGHPAKPYYEATQGVGILLHALMELDALPARWQNAF